MKKPLKDKPWWVYNINCDCCNDDRAYTYQPRWMFGPRCQHCGTVQGFISYSFTGKVVAKTEIEAIQKANKIALEKCHKHIAERKKDQTAGYFDIIRGGKKKRRNK